ncbi:GMP synthase [Cryptosporidium bovis]|uniref:GMP synthase n=1 Tax=Cryptosporidium bovis TaxID=310047 RepID=UPI00351A306C|nr:GMP synthase [Cryptosporidium bovis]
MPRSKIVVLDFGSQYAHLIAKRFRVLGYYSEIALPSTDLSIFEKAKGIVFSGGPASVYDKDIPEFNSEILNLDIPILGLCYGHYIVNIGYGGKVDKSPVGEFGFATLNLNPNIKSPIFNGIEKTQQVWMSHQDCVLHPGVGFEVIGSTKDCSYAALQNLKKKRFTLQFHCEVRDTLCGDQIFKNFVKYCGMEKNWDQDMVLNIIIEGIRTQAAGRNALLFLSGGVDSTVAFALLNKALGQDRVLGLHIDNGFMRKGESKHIEEAYIKFGFNNFIVEDASESFLRAVSGLTDPQSKRIAVGENFITIKNEVVARLKLEENNWLLAQGTLYPDIIESGGTINSKTIKTHHNRVPGIQALVEKNLVIEPIRDLYKDEVRIIGKKLGLSDELIMRHPFPGPGLSINVLCNDNKSWGKKDDDEYSAAMNELMMITIHKFSEDCFKDMKSNVLPVRTVGVQGDYRTYNFPAVLTFASEQNGFFYFPTDREKIEHISSSIINSAKYINRTCIKLYQNPKIPTSEMKLQEGYCDRFRLDQLREVDNIVLTELHNSGWYNKIFQHLTISLPFASSKERASFVLRPVCSDDVMTARFALFPEDILRTVVSKIAELDFVDALYYDVTNKPPATFGWE